METICQFCNKQFSNKYNLKIHINTSKKCLKLQNKDINMNFNCNICNKVYTSKQSLKKHKCNQQPPITINNNTINNNTTNNNITNNNTTNTTNIYNDIHNTTNIKIKIIQDMSPLDLSEYNIRQIVQQEFTNEYLKKDHEGVAQFIIDKILKRDPSGNYNYISVDGSRHIGVYKDNETGNIIKDSKYMKLAKPVYSQVVKKAMLITNEEHKDSIENEPEKMFEIQELKNSLKLINKYTEPTGRFKNYIANGVAIIYPIQTK